MKNNATECNENCVQTKKLKACLYVLNELIDYKQAIPDSFEHMDSDIDVCSYCKIPFLYNDNCEGDNNEGDGESGYNYCHDTGLNKCEKKWCKRSDFCKSDFEKCEECNKDICTSHIYSINNKNYCRTCQKTIIRV